MAYSELVNRLKATARWLPPQAVISGGALRDATLGNPIKDVDVSLSWNAISYLYNLPLKPKQLKTKNSNIVAVYDMTETFYDFQLEFVVYKPSLWYATTPLQRINNYHINQISMDHQGNITSTMEAMRDLANHTMTKITPWESKEQLYRAQAKLLNYNSRDGNKVKLHLAENNS